MRLGARALTPKEHRLTSQVEARIEYTLPFNRLGDAKDGLEKAGWAGLFRLFFSTYTLRYRCFRFLQDGTL